MNSSTSTILPRIMLPFMAVACMTVWCTLPAAAQEEDAQPPQPYDMPDAVPPPPSEREARPLYEVGVSARLKYVPDYPAADEYRVRGVPLPHIKYRGRIIRAGEFGETFLGRVINSDRYFLSIGARLAPAVDSNNNDARQGLEDLDSLLQIGPQFGFKLLPGSLDRDRDLNIIAQARWVISFDTSNWEFGVQGILLNPRLQYVDYSLLGPGSEAFIQAGPNFTYNGLADYFYTVPQRFETPNRRAFKAEEGYLGFSVDMGGEIPINERLRGFLGATAAYHRGSKNRASPLFKREFNYAVRTRLTWVIYKSKRMAKE